MENEEQPKKTTGERVQDVQNAVDSGRSFVDWVRDVIAWIKGLFGG